MAGAKIRVQFVAAAVGGRDAAPIGAPYRPHFRVGAGEYLGVQFVDGPGTSVVAGVVATANVQFVYEGVSYAPLQPGVQFQVLEGPHIVGIGVVEELTA
jgi:translation elongation factor EF-Tu-like GTPase